MSKDLIGEAVAYAEIRMTKVKLLAFFQDEGIDMAMAATAMFSLQKDILRTAGEDQFISDLNKAADEAGKRAGIK